MEQAANQRKSKKHGKHSASRESTPGDVLVGVKSKTEPYLSLAAAQERTKDLGESTVLIDHGELLQGVLDKAQCGPSSFGLVHCVYEVRHCIFLLLSLTLILSLSLCLFFCLCLSVCLCLIMFE